MYIRLNTQNDNFFVWSGFSFFVIIDTFLGRLPIAFQYLLFYYFQSDAVYASSSWHFLLQFESYFSGSSASPCKGSCMVDFDMCFMLLHAIMD